MGYLLKANNTIYRKEYYYIDKYSSIIFSINGGENTIFPLCEFIFVENKFVHLNLRFRC